LEVVVLVVLLISAMARLVTAGWRSHEAHMALLAVLLALAGGGGGQQPTIRIHGTVTVCRW
jgi:hypothetical protein